MRGLENSYFVLSLFNEKTPQNIQVKAIGSLYKHCWNVKPIWSRSADKLEAPVVLIRIFFRHVVA